MAFRFNAKNFAAFGRFKQWPSEETGPAFRHIAMSVLGVLLILFLVAASITLGVREYRIDGTRNLEFAVVRAATAAEIDLTVMESAHRQFLLTGQANALRVFQQRQEAIVSHLAALISLLHDDPKRLEAVNAVAVGFQRWVTQAAQPEIDRRKANRDVSAQITRGSDSIFFDPLAGNLNHFVGQANARLESLNGAGRWRKLLQTCGFAVLSVFATGILATASWRSYQAFRKHLQTFQSHLEKAAAVTAQTRAIIDNTLDGVITVDQQGVIQSLNPAAERMFVQKAQKVIGQNVSILVPQRLFFQDMKDSGRGAIIAEGQRQGYFPFPIEISVGTMEVSGRRHFVAIVRDISDRQKSEDTLRHISLGVSAATGEEFLRSLLKQLSKALQNDFAFLVELSGTGPDRVATLSIAEQGNLMRQGQFDPTNTAFGEAINKGFRSYLEGVRTRFPEDRTLHDLAIESFVAAPLLDHHGRTVGLIGILDRKDLLEMQIIESTLQIFAARAAAEIERKCAETALAAEKERLAVTMRSIADGFITIDNSGSVQMINAVAEHLTGWTQASAAGKPLASVFQILNERNRKRCSHALQRIVESGIAEGLEGATILVTRGGTECLIESNTAPIRDTMGGRLGAVVVFRDVTEKRRMEEERAKADKLESLGVVAGGIAHDFNNVLTAILGNLSLVLLKPKLDPEIGERLGSAKRATNRAQELAMQLLTFSKGGAPVKQTASISQLVRDTLSLTLHGSRVTTQLALKDDLYPVDIDPGQMSQVINNIATNADQAMPAGGLLSVSAENVELTTENASLGLTAGRWVKVAFQDQGIGIPEEYLQKIFDLYFSTKPKGSGLGLATAYSIVKSHGGVIAVDSEPGEGATFNIYLPASQNELRAAAAAAPVPTAANASRVLVLDDEEAICMLVTCALEPLGYQVTETNDGTQAIAAYEKAMQDGNPYDLFISDLIIPGGMGGAETIKRLREIDPNILAIVSSGYANDPIMSQHQGYGFSGMIAKPYEIDALGRKVAEVLAQPRRPRVVFHDFDRKTA